MKNEIDLRSYFDILIRRWIIVLVMPIVAMVVAALGTLAIKPVYEATATIALAPSTISVSISTQAPPYYLLVDSPRKLPTAYTPAYYLAILKSPDVAGGASLRLPAAFSSNGADKSLIDVAVRGSDPQEAAQLATTWAQLGAQRIEKLLTPSDAQVTLAQSRVDAAEDALIKFAQENRLSESDLADPFSITTLSPDKKSELARLLRVRDAAEETARDFASDYEHATVLASTTYKPTVVPASVPTAPVSPKLAQSVLVAGVLGLLIGVLAAFAVEYMLRRR